MKRFVVGIIALAVLMATSRPVMAQTKTLMSEMRVETGTIEAIDAATRTVTIKKPDGTFVSTVAGSDVKRFSELKRGDKVTARYYENVVIRLKRPGESDVASATKSTTPSEQVLPGGTKAKQVTVTATITSINMDIPSITFTGPSGYVYASKVVDKAALAGVKVGDKFDIVWTEAMLVSIEAGK
jgi:Cu/Ag efflux protein CusF